ncbi:DUF58 domain-containing protein [Candidatus Riflebacteria bacterium]
MTSEQKLPRYIDPGSLGKLSNLEMKARFLVEGLFSGLHKSPFRGFSVEFAEYRNYFLGDNLKHIDWRLYARTDSLYIKLHEEETNLNVQIVLDASSSMHYKKGGSLSKFEYAAYLSVCLAFLCLKQQDSVGLTIYSEKVLKELPSSNRMSHMRIIANIIEILEKQLTPKMKTGTSFALASLAKRLRKRGLIILISDLLDEPDNILANLKHFKVRKNDVLVFQVLDPSELNFDFTGDYQFVDLESGEELVTDCEAVKIEYDRELKGFLNRYRKGLKESGIDYFLYNTTIPLEISLMDYLYKRKTLKVVG